MLSIDPISAFNDNYIWCLADRSEGTAYVVDPGEAAPVEQYLKDQGLELAGILITHHHYDHTGGIAALTGPRKIPVYGPDNPAIEGITDTLVEGDTLSLPGLSAPGLQFTVLAVPGHTLDHIALYAAHSPLGPLLFCGDTLFAGGCGRIFEGDPAMMLTSLDKLAALPDTTRVYCAHEYTLANLAFAQAVEPDNSALQQRLLDDQQRRQAEQPTVPSTLALEHATNPFLRCRESSVVHAAEQHSGRRIADENGVFATVRSWKDAF